MIDTFLTAYDPSDLPGTSIDPLGFDRGYNYLADRILPGLTNVAAHPRYLGLICAGIHLAGHSPDTVLREQIRKRQEFILRLERFWALANVLARPDGSSAVRGVTYAQARVEEIVDSRLQRTNANYPLLSRQAQYGAIGIYGNVAHGMRFLDRAELQLSPALGEVAAEAFIEETEMPISIQRAIRDDADVSIAALKSWGQRAHVEAEVRRLEAQCVNEALHADPVRSRMCCLLAQNQFIGNEESEIGRLSRISHKLNGRAADRDLRQAIDCILNYESCYQFVSLAFERLLWVARRHAGAAAHINEFRVDAVLNASFSGLGTAAPRFKTSLERACEPPLNLATEVLTDVARFIQETATAKKAAQFVEVIIKRHTDVQHGKFDKGRRKMPWMELRDNKVSLTVTRIGGMNSEPQSLAQISAHPYRLATADAFNLVCPRAATA